MRLILSTIYVFIPIVPIDLYHPALSIPFDETRQVTWYTKTQALFL